MADLEVIGGTMDWDTFNERGAERRIQREVNQRIRALKIDLVFMLGGLFLFLVVVILITWGLTA